MNDPHRTHPDAGLLASFGLGRLSDEESSVIEAHVTACDVCRATLEAAPGDELVDLLRAAAPPGLPPQRLQPGYEILGELGRGGMGVVYRARQRGLNRLVALKMIATGPDAGPDAGPVAVSRFRREAEAAARLQHPNIVQVHEVGEQEGKPYLAMELVDGPTLAAKLAEGPLPPRQAAELVAALARAVEYAHGCGIVHRDLKPLNVLLAAALTVSSADGSRRSFPFTPKITDFGLAKNLAAGPGPTETGTVLGSPCYMAPEQIGGRSDQVGPTADVYSLGAILYDALTGRPPFRAATALETLDLVRSAEPVPPARFQPGLPRDLQTTCLKCLEKQPAKRYATAALLAADLERFLAGEPIRARPASPGERLVKWARRKPALATALILLTVSLAALVAGVVAHNVRLQREVRRAEEATAEAVRQGERADRNYRKARDAIVRMFDRLDQTPLGEVPRLTEIQARQAEDALAFFEAIYDDLDNPDPVVRLDTARKLFQAATLQAKLGRLAEAKDHFLRAVALYDGLVAEGRPQDCRWEAAQSRDSLGGVYSRLKDFASAERCHREALAVFEELKRERAVLPGSGRIAWSYQALGVICLATKRVDEAEQHFLRAAAEFRESVRRDPGLAPTDRLSAAGCLVNLVHTYNRAGRFDRGREAFREAEALLLPLLKEPAWRAQAALNLSAACTNLSEISRGQRDNAAAEALATRGLELVEPIYRDDPQLQEARERVYALHGVRALARDGLGHFRESLEDWDRVVELAEPSERDGWRINRAVTLARVGEYARANAEADDLASKAGWKQEKRYDLACAYALLAEGTGEAAAVRAVGMLRALQQEGFFRKQEYAGLLKDDDDLKSLRKRADFQQLLQGS